MTSYGAWSLFAIILAVLFAINLALLFVLTQGPEVHRWWIARKRRKLAAIEAELDRKAEELRDTIYEIASQLRMDGQQAREDMIREACRRAGRAPD